MEDNDHAERFLKKIGIQNLGEYQDFYVRSEKN